MKWPVDIYFFGEKPPETPMVPYELADALYRALVNREPGDVESDAALDRWEAEVEN